MRAITKARVSKPRELEVGFVNECRGVERIVAPLVAPALPRHLAQPVVDDRHQLIERRAIAAAPALQQIPELERRRLHIVPTRRERSWDSSRPSGQYGDAFVFSNRGGADRLRLARAVSKGA